MNSFCMIKQIYTDRIIPTYNFVVSLILINGTFYLVLECVSRAFSFYIRTSVTHSFFLPLSDCLAETQLNSANITSCRWWGSGDLRSYTPRPSEAWWPVIVRTLPSGQSGAAVPSFLIFLCWVLGLKLTSIPSALWGKSVKFAGSLGNF